MDPNHAIGDRADGEELFDLPQYYHPAIHGESEAVVERSPPGKIHFEARVRDDFVGDIEEVCDQILEVFSLETVPCISLVLWTELLDSMAFSGLFPKQLQSLKAVQYVGSDTASPYPLIGKTALEVHGYRICTSLEHLEDDGTLLQAEIIQLPNLRFEGIWERLVFDTDIRGNLIRMMTNMVNFSRAMTTSNQQARMNRLILVSGPPGTGKTTLCQGLAQKLSIRLNRLYKETKLIQINAANLLSKFFSESAKNILQIFSAIEKNCCSHPNQFICVLIDEVESLTPSRTNASSRGEVQDTIRATNALLTGFDRVKSQPNLIILCTSNMVDTLDAAFLDRCGHKVVISPPSLEASYQILRGGIEVLITANIIIFDLVPCYRDARLFCSTQPTAIGSRLIRLCKLIEIGAERNTDLGQGVIRNSARFLAQLPEVALADRLTTDCCSLDDTFHHIEQFIYNNVTGLKSAMDNGILEGGEWPDRKRKREEPPYADYVHAKLGRCRK